MKRSVDAVVIGLGGMGSATLAELARRGASVLGIEQFTPDHDLGSSSGRSRLIRKAYFEHPAYVPMLQRAYDLWRALENEDGTRILVVTGILTAARPKSNIIVKTLESARLHGLAVEELDVREMRRRFPMFAPRDDEHGVFEPEGGFVVPELAVAAHLRRAQAAGAEMLFEAHVSRWYRKPSAHGITVELEDGSTVEAARVALCAGAWLEALALDLGLPLVVQRNVQHWFEPLNDSFSIGRCPAFFIDRTEQPTRLYGFPDYGYGVKAAFHAWGEVTHADELDRSIRESDITPVRALLDAWMPGAAGRYLGGKACMYTLTPDENFIVGPHPGEPAVIIAGGFSGHGFKFVPVIAEIVADLMLEAEPAFEIGFLSPQRFEGATL